MLFSLQVYEEQGYEDAAYDHGGYKKAGEKHEKKFIPREDKTDIARSSDQSIEQAENVNVSPFNTTDSSHSASQTTTERNNFVNRRNKRPKARIPWSRPKTTPNERFSKPPSSNELLDSERRPADRLAAASRRRRPKPTKPALIEASTPSDRKVMEESKYHATKKYITELDIKPTTYRPVPPYIKGSSLRKPSGPVAKVPFVPRIGTDGYKFENPFQNFKDFSNVLTIEHPLASKTSAHIRYVHEKESIQRIPQYKVHESISKTAESREVNKIQQSSTATAKPADFTKFLTKSKAFPYSLIENSNKFAHDQRKLTDPHIKPTNFPYKIVDSTEISQSIEPKIRIEEKWRFKTKFSPEKATFVDFKEEKVRKNPAFAFGEPDRAPWIPITPKDIYDLHGYQHHRSAPIEIKVRESDHSAEITSNKRVSPIRLVDSPKNIATSYSIHHSTFSPPVRSRPLKNPFPIFENPNRFDIHDVAESSYKLKGFGGVTPASYMSMIPQLAPYAHSTISRPTIASMDYVTPRMELKTSHPYDIITAHSSDIRSAFSSHPTFKPVFHRTSISTSTTPRFSNSRDADTLSSNRYAIFQRMNNTTPVESTTSSLKEMNDQFNKLFSEERDKFLFRHPHLSRETTNFLKAEPEDTTVNTTTKRDIIVSSVKNGTITHLTKVSKRNDIHPQPIIVYPQDYSSSAKYVERLTLAHFSAPENNTNSQLPLNYHDRLATLSNHLKNDTGLRPKRDVNYEDEELLKMVLDGTTTEISVNIQKYPFYKTVRPDGISKYSVLRYISNPMEIPKKQVGRMTFYESRNNIDCVEPTPPHSVVPQREEGQWAYNPRPKLPRITLGDKISCLKIKFFGSDPLDNPFFKEESVGFPEIFDPQSNRARTIDDEVERDQGTAAGIVIESVDSQDDYELIPKSLLRNKAIKVTNQFKRAVPESNEPNFMKSSVRQWIDSLAQPKTFKLYKRSPRDEFESSNELDPADKRVSKVLFVGGFLNRENVNKAKKKKQKYNERIWPSGLELVSTTESSLAPEVTDTTPDPRIMQKFNEELTSILENSDVSSEEVVEAINDQNKPVSKPNLSHQRKTKPSLNEIKYIPSASEMKLKANRNQHRVYVDALTSLRNQQQSAPKNKSSGSNVNYKYNYKEPTWRLKNRIAVHSPTTTIRSSTENTEIDSLLYVINPKTGTGKWMKVLRVEEMNDVGIKSDSEGSSNDETASAISPPAYYSDDEDSDGQSTTSKYETQMPCQSDNSEIKKPFGADYDVST